jgi:hypothetical protein
MDKEKEVNMTPVIRIDDDVMAELKKRAITYDLVFESPNATLRKILNLDTENEGFGKKEDGIQKDRSNTTIEPITGWPKDLMECIKRMGKEEFTLEEVYQFEPELQKKYPNNKNIRSAIRGTLQILRDKGYLTFIKRGEYKINK